MCEQEKKIERDLYFEFKAKSHLSLSFSFSFSELASEIFVSEFVCLYVCLSVCLFVCTLSLLVVGEFKTVAQLNLEQQSFHSNDAFAPSDTYRSTEATNWLGQETNSRAKC